jgi:pyrroline-5-carboxylate reductase
MMDKRIAFVGGGNMAEAILGGLLAAGVSRAGDVAVADVSETRRVALESAYGVATTAGNAQAVRGADVVVLAVKPQQVAEALAAAEGAFSSDQLLVSICAGVPTKRLEGLVPARVVRTMPNLPALVRRGVTAICAGERATAGDMDVAETLFAAVGAVVRLPESQMNEVTALSGSGPGYVFAFIEAMAAEAAAMGIDASVARTMAVETVRGAAEMASSTGEEPCILRERVSSKGGTTLAGLAAMRAGGFAEAVAAGLRAARDRSAELAG